MGTIGKRLNVRGSMFLMSEGISTKPYASPPRILPESRYRTALSGFIRIRDYAYVEPVCTIPSCRGKGIAAALLSEAFSRAKALGAKKAYVISDLPFYEKLGFEKTQHYSFYRKA